MHAHGRNGTPPFHRPLFSVTTIPAYTEIKKSNKDAKSGVYTINPMKEEGKTPFKAYCEMEANGGGWTLTANVAAGDNVHSWNSELKWESAAPIGKPTDNPAPRNLDYKSRAYSELEGDDFMFFYEGAYMFRTDQHCLGGNTVAFKLRTLPWECPASAYLTHMCTHPCHVASDSVATNRDSAMSRGRHITKLFLKAGEAYNAQQTNNDHVYFSTNSRDHVDNCDGLGSFWCTDTHNCPRMWHDISTHADHPAGVPAHNYYTIFVR